MRFGEKLRELRDAAKLSRKRLAEMSGIAFGTIYSYENGSRAPSLAATFALARALGVECSVFSQCDDMTGGQGEKE